MKPDDVMVLVLQRLSDYLGTSVTEKDLNVGYDTLGADSMDMVVLAFELEKLLGRKIKPEVFMQHETIRGALDALFTEDDDGVRS